MRPDFCTAYILYHILPLLIRAQEILLENFFSTNAPISVKAARNCVLYLELKEL